MNTRTRGDSLYKYAGSFLEVAAKLCFSERFPKSGSVRIPNTQGRRPRTFEIDCLVATEAIEIKWRDATTDGDHITKEHTRIQAIVDAGYTPIRVMFYYPNRARQSRFNKRARDAIQRACAANTTTATSAWRYVQKRTEDDLLEILRKLAQENAPKN